MSHFITQHQLCDCAAWWACIVFEQYFLLLHQISLKMEVKIKPHPLCTLRHWAGGIGQEASTALVLLMNKIEQAVPALANIKLVCHTNEGFISSDKLTGTPLLGLYCCSLGT